MNKKELSEYFKKIGAEGGKRSRRKLTRKDARAMAEKSAEVRRRNKRNAAQNSQKP